MVDDAGAGAPPGPPDEEQEPDRGGPSPWRRPLAALLIALPLIAAAAGGRFGCEAGVIDLPVCGADAPVAQAATEVEIEGGQTTVTVADPGATPVTVSQEPTALFPGHFLKFVVVAPDGSRVLYVTANSLGMTDADMWVVPKGQPKTLLKDLGNRFWVARPAWCQTNPGEVGRIAYVMQGDTGPGLTGLELWVMNGDGSDDRRVLVGTEENGFGPDIFYGAQPVLLRFMAGCQKLKYSNDVGDDRHVVDLSSGDVLPSVGLPLQPPQPTPPPTPAVPPTPEPVSVPCVLKPFAQTDPRWGHLRMQTENTEIRSWGCALTSTAMIFNYYGVDTDPGRLNDCAAGNADLLYWDPVRSRCAADKIPRPTQWNGDASWADLEASLRDGRPAIVGLQGGPAGSHFLVVTAGAGNQAENYRVADSWDGSTYKTLADYINPNKGYVLKWIVLFEGEPPRCTASGQPDPGLVTFTSPVDGKFYNSPQEVRFRTNPTSASAQVESSHPNGAVIDGEGAHTITVTVTQDGQPYRKRLNFFIDRTAPQASATWEPIDATSVQLTVTATDEQTTVTEAHYQVDGGPWQPVNAATEQSVGLALRPITVDGLAPGAHVIRYYAVDAAGNRSPERSLPVIAANPYGGVITAVAGNGAAGFDGDGGPALQAALGRAEGVAVARDGSFYIADSRNHRIRRVAPDGTITSVAGTGQQGFGGDGGPATAAQLFWPSVVVIGPDGSLYVTDSRNHRVRRIAPDGTISTIAGTGTAGYSGDGGPATSASLNRPTGLSIGGDGALYVADTDNHRVRRIGPDGVIETMAGTGNPGFSGDGGQATAAALNGPTGVSASAHGLYIVDTRNQRVRRMNADGVIETVAGGGRPPSGKIGDGGPAVEASLGLPVEIAVSPEGYFYIADAGHRRIRRVGAEGAIVTVAGNGAQGVPADGALSTEISLGDPTGIALGPDGSFFIADLGAGRIYQVNPAQQIPSAPGTLPAAPPPSAPAGPSPAPTEAPAAPTPVPAATQPAGGEAPAAPAEAPPGPAVPIVTPTPAPAAPPPPPPPSTGAISTLAGDGQQGFAGDGGGAAAQARLAKPHAVAAAPDGSLYVADRLNHRVRRIAPDGTITTVAGGPQPGSDQIGDGGPAVQASLWEPRGLAVAADGVLYIADTGNGRIRRVTPDGVITTLAGGGALPAGEIGDGGPATQARLMAPEGLALGPDGSLYIADRGNHRVRKVAPDGTITTVAGTGARDHGGDDGPATLARLAEPEEVAVAPDGTLYIADSLSRRIRRVTPDGIISTVAGDATADGLGDGGPAVAARLIGPRGLALGPDGSLYVADSDDDKSRVRRILPSGVITTVAGAGKQGFAGDGGPAVEARLFEPEGVAVLPDGRLVIADAQNNRVRQVAAP